MPTSSSPSTLLHRMAVLTAVTALLPITVGALVTTMNWGMAFADWPTSDGHNMFLYPWLRDLRVDPGKFTEHGHRLGGAFIGLCSIGLAVVAWRKAENSYVRWLGPAILAAVIVQGLLGGNRVLRNDPRMAMVHGVFAAVVFSAMCLLATVTSRRWKADEEAASGRGAGELVPDWSRPFLLAAPFVVMLQYLLGSSLRHLGLALHEHLGGAVLVALVTSLAAWAGSRSPLGTVRRLGLFLALAVGMQLLLGAGAWVTRFGFATFGYVAVNQAPLQVIFRTAHTVVAMFVVASSSLLAISVIRFEKLLPRATSGFESSPSLAGTSLVKGGA